MAISGFAKDDAHQPAVDAGLGDPGAVVDEIEQHESAWPDQGFNLLLKRIPTAWRPHQVVQRHRLADVGQQRGEQLVVALGAVVAHSYTVETDFIWLAHDLASSAELLDVGGVHHRAALHIVCRPYRPARSSSALTRVVMVRADRDGAAAGHRLAMTCWRLAAYSDSVIAPVARSVSSSCNRCAADGAGGGGSHAGAGFGDAAAGENCWALGRGACAAALLRRISRTCSRTTG